MALLVPALFLVLLTPNWVAGSPHQPLNLTWQLVGPHGNLVKQIAKVSPLGVWYPNIVFNHCEVAGPDWLGSDRDLWCSRRKDCSPPPEVKCLCLPGVVQVDD